MQGASSYFNGPHYRILAIVCQATCKHLDPWDLVHIGCNVYTIARSVLFSSNLSFFNKYSSNESAGLLTIPQLGCGYFRKRTEPAMPVPDTTKESASVG